MILLAIASLLLFFVTYFTGISTVNFLKKFLSLNISINFFEIFLFGLITCYVYFNLLSFFIPVNYLTLIPLLLLSIYFFSKKTVRQKFLFQLRQTGSVFFSVKNLLFTIPFLALLFLYWIIPPLNLDSGEYHYIAIRWYEQFKVIPGLANVHGRLAFNPGSFIISAAWSFTDLTGQSIYPLNGVLVFVFYVWLVKKVLMPAGLLYRLIILMMVIFLFRVTLINISSPSSDVLSSILLFYCGFRTYELMKEHKNSFSDYFVVLILIFVSVTTKLSAIPSLLLIPFIYFIVVEKNRQISVVIKSMLLAAIIIVPWLVRNYILSGYLLYPVPGTNLFYADWAVPHNVIQLDYLFSKYGPRTITVDFITMQKMNIVQLTKVWYNNVSVNSLSSLLITLLSLLSPALWILFTLLKKKISLTIFLLWCIYYCCTWIWFLNSPEHRFGLPYLTLAAGIPLLALAQTVSLKWNMPAAVFTIIIWLFSLHYVLSVFKRVPIHSFAINDFWLKPLKDKRYLIATKNNNFLQTFTSVNLGNGVKLYLPYGDHECLNAPGPCMNWRYGEIEMRGNKMEDGFRNKTDEVKKYFPFVDIK